MMKDDVPRSRPNIFGLEASWAQLSCSDLVDIACHGEPLASVECLSDSQAVSDCLVGDQHAQSKGFHVDQVIKQQCAIMRSASRKARQCGREPAREERRGAVSSLPFGGIAPPFFAWAAEIEEEKERRPGSDDLGQNTPLVKEKVLVDVFVVKTKSSRSDGNEPEYAYKAVVESKRLDGRAEGPSTGRVLWSLNSDEVRTFTETAAENSDEKEKCNRLGAAEQSAWTQECEVKRDHLK